MTNCRKTLASIHAALFSSLLLSSVPGADWPQWRGPNRDGVWDESGIIEAFPREGLKIEWRAPVALGWSSPIVAGDRLWLTDVEIENSKARERVLCFNVTSGKLLWTHRYDVNYPDWALGPNGGGPRATPILQDGRVYTLGALGDLICFNANTGEIAWSKSLAKEYGVKEFSGITASPLIEGSLLILYICGKPDACVVALNKDTGVEAWRALDDMFSYSSPIVISAGGQRQIIVWTQEAVTSLNPATGQVWWRELVRTPGDQAVSTPVFCDNRLLIAGLMLKLNEDRPGASILWPESRAASKRVLSNTSTAFVRGGYVYSAKISGELVCLDARTGDEVWKADTVTKAGNGSSIHLTLNGGSFLLFTDEGNLIRARLNEKGYEELSRIHLLDPTYSYGKRKVAWTPPAYANRHVFVRSDQELVCASLEVTKEK
jgi:outer membrane protein assembly factor BamB